MTTTFSTSIVVLLALWCRDSWPRSHSSWALPSQLTQFIVPADKRCVDALGPGVHVALLPPEHALVTVSGDTLAVPAGCCHLHKDTPHPEHKIASALWDLIAYANSDAGNGVCEPQRQASHKCPMLHPGHQQRLVAFEVHLLQVQHFNQNVSTEVAAAQNSETATAAAEEWQTVLQQFLGGEPAVMDAQNGFLIVYVPPSHLAAAVTEIARQPEVVHVLPHRVHFLHNLNDISVQLQTGGPAAGGVAANEAQFWDAGVNGSAQVIGLGDSGIDMEHCAFADPAVPFDSFTVDRSRVPVFRSTKHRKVALYYMCASPQPKDQEPCL